MDMMSLSDEEILKAVKFAREVAIKNGTPLNVAIQGAMEVIVEEKRKIAENEVLKTSLKENKGIKIDYENFEIEVRKQIKSLYEKAWKMANDYDIARVPQNIKEAQEGAIKEKYRQEILDSTIKRYKPEYRKEAEEYTDTIIQLNRLVRETYYARYMSMSDNELEEERLRTIENYKKLQKKGNESKLRLENNRRWVDGLTTREGTFEALSAHNSLGLGFEVAIQHPTSDISSYDYKYKLCKSLLDIDSEPESWIGVLNIKSKFEDAQRFVDQIIINLERMSCDAFREYKISQMELTEQEKQLFDQSIAEYSLENDKSFGHGM